MPRSPHTRLKTSTRGPIRDTALQLEFPGAVGLLLPGERGDQFVSYLCPVMLICQWRRLFFETAPQVKRGDTTHALGITGRNGSGFFPGDEDVFCPETFQHYSTRSHQSKRFIIRPRVMLISPERNPTWHQTPVGGPTWMIPGRGGQGERGYS